MTDKTKKSSKKNKKDQREAETSEEEESDSQAAMLQSLQEKIAEMEGKLEDRYGFTFLYSHKMSIKIFGH